jgi:hypothetical protein
LRFQPYYQYLTGLGEREWNELTPEQQRKLIRASKQRPSKLTAVEEDESKSFVTDERVAFQIRIIGREELAALPVFEMY